MSYILHTFQIYILNFSMLNYGLRTNKKAGLWYTDGCKTSKGTRAGVYGYGARRKLKFQYTTAFQAEV
jgi:hypothetical protein